MVPSPVLKKITLGLAIASCVAILISIAISQILLAVALGFLLLSGLPLRWPRFAIFLALFLGWTLASLAASPDPALGLPQVRKMLVFTMLLIVYSSVRTLREAKWLAMAWILVGTFTAGRGLVQFAGDIAGARAAGIDFYHFYIADRIRGFMSHWMTFSGQELFVLLLVVSFLLYGGAKKQMWLWLTCAAVIGIALLLSQTRSIWIAAVVAGFYLLWNWNKRAALAMPAVVVLLLLAAPAAVQQRARSIYNPETETDSNQHRIVCWLTGWQMIKAHPIFGVGPEEISRMDVFDSYVPASIHWPLPAGWYGHLHSIYIHYAAERGIPATLLLTAALLMALYDFRRARLSLPPGRSDRRFLLEAATACIIGTMVSGVFELNLGDSEVLTMFLAITCLGYLAANAAEQPSQALSEAYGLARTG